MKFQGKEKTLPGLCCEQAVGWSAGVGESAVINKRLELKTNTIAFFTRSIDAGQLVLKNL